MTLSLDHQQRLNLIAVLNAHPAKGRDLHAIWHIQEMLDLSAEEKGAIDFHQETHNGRQVQLWDVNKSIPVRSFELSDINATRIRQAIDEFPGFVSSRDRVWLEPLLAQLPDVAESNGTAPKENGGV